MQNTYQDKITDIRGSNSFFGKKLEGGKKLKVVSNYKPAGDQPNAIKELVRKAKKGENNQVLLGVTAQEKLLQWQKL